MHITTERMKERERGWQPFVFAECIDIKLEEEAAYVPFLHHYIFNVNYMLYKCNQSVIDASLIYKKKQQ